MSFNEAKVRDSLGELLDAVEPGLKLIDKEYYLPPKICTRGFLDLLAKDSKGRYVIIEVKRTKQASRETAHEILKYVESVKLHLGLRENELRVVVAAIDWEEMLIPFSSFVSRTDIRVEGWALEVDEHGEVVSSDIISPVAIHSDRVLAPWHELSFYEDEKSFEKGILSYERSCRSKGIESFVLVIMRPAEGSDIKLPSTKQNTMRKAIAAMAQDGGFDLKDVPEDLYSHIIYFAMQQLSDEDYKARLPADSETLEYIEGMAEDEALAALHEGLLDLEPRSESDFFEIAYPAKFKARIQEDEGWAVTEVRRYGAFKRNDHLTDSVIVEEIEGKKGNSKQTLGMTFNPSDTADIADVRGCMEECLQDNAAWRGQMNFVLDEISKLSNTADAKIHIANMSSAITTVYLSVRDENGPLYIPSYHILVPSENPTVGYFGCLKPNATKANFEKLIDEFYEGDERALLFTLQWGGYESRDTKITRRMGLRYSTYKVEMDDEDRQFYRLDDGDWEPCEPTDPTSSYYEFIEKNKDFVQEVCKLYSSRWDGSMIIYEND